jgi:hypothetical protein
MLYLFIDWAQGQLHLYTDIIKALYFTRGFRHNLSENSKESVSESGLLTSNYRILC